MIRKDLQAMGLAVILSFGIAAVPAVSLAQWSGPSDTGQAAGSVYASSTIAAIKANPMDEQKVAVVGQIIRKTGDETYLFTDGTGQIVVEIDDEDFPGQPVNEKTKLRLEGKVDTHLRRDVDIDVENVIIMP